MWAALLLVLAEVAIAPYLAPEQEFDPENGLLLQQSASPGENGIVVYERPVVLLPPIMTEGETHTSQRRFVLRVDGEKRDVGSHYFEAELLGVEALDGYRDCVKIRRHTMRMDFSGALVGEDVTEWYARGVGLVKAEGERVWKDADGNTIRTERID